MKGSLAGHRRQGGGSRQTVNVDRSGRAERRRIQFGHGMGRPKARRPYVAPDLSALAEASLVVRTCRICQSRAAA